MERTIYLQCADPVVHTFDKEKALLHDITGERIILFSQKYGNQYSTEEYFTPVPEYANDASDFCHYCGVANQIGDDNLRVGFDCYYCGSN